MPKKLHNIYATNAPWGYIQHSDSFDWLGITEDKYRSNPVIYLRFKEGVSFEDVAYHLHQRGWVICTDDEMEVKLVEQEKQRMEGIRRSF